MMSRAISVGALQFAGANPFSSRFVRPGAIPFLFPENVDAELLAGQLANQRWCGQIVGPHGSGKSTLLHSLVPWLRRVGRDVHWFTLNSQTRALPVTRAIADRWTDLSQVIVDGYEQLGWRTRRWVKRMCRRSGCGLLVTSHRPVGLPNLFCTSVSRQIARDVVERLVPDMCRMMSGEVIDEACRRHGDNLREALFELYDVYELRRCDPTNQ